jgi:hypothetical protein
MSENEFVKSILINRVYPPDIITRFANNFVVQHDAEQFYLSFFDVWMPMIIGETEEETRMQLDALEKIDAKCVARIVVSPEKLRELINLLENNLKNYEQKTSMTVDSNESE